MFLYRSSDIEYNRNYDWWSLCNTCNSVLYHKSLVHQFGSELLDAYTYPMTCSVCGSFYIVSTAIKQNNQIIRWRFIDETNGLS